jgi:hypothetical protein
VGTGDARDDEFEPVGTPGGDSFLLPVEVRALIFPENARLAGAEKASLRLAAQQALTGIFDNLPLGGPVVYNRLISALMDLPGVADANITLHPPGAPDNGYRRNLQPPDSQRAALDPAKLIIHFAGDVLFDFDLKVALLGSSSLADATKEIRGKLAEFFAAAPASVAVPDLMTAIGAGASYSLQAADLAWTAEHDASGLVLTAGGGSGAPATPIAEGDRAVLRDVSVEIKA